MQISEAESAVMDVLWRTHPLGAEEVVAALADSRDIAARLPAKDGYQLSLQVADGERRLLESTPQGIRLLASENLFVSTPDGLLGGLDGHPNPQ